MIDTARLTAILHRHDPVGIAFVDVDEHDIEAVTIVERLAGDMEIPEITALVHDVFVLMFDDRLVPAAGNAIWHEIAMEILADERP